MALQNNSRIRQRRRQRLIIVMTLLGLIAAAAFFVLSPAAKKNQAEVIPDGAIPVPVAKADIPIGTRIGRNLFRNNYMRPSEVPIDAIIAPADIVGRFSTKVVLTGEYFRDSDVSSARAPAGFSGTAKPGMRIVHISAKLFPGALETLKVGDKVDLLSIAASASAVGGGGGSGADIASLQKQASTAWGGNNPGDSRARARAKRELNAAGGVAGGGVAAAMTATLIAENAEIMFIPKPKRMPSTRDDEFVVFQMTPEDAHVSILASSIGSTMRVVFRPFDDNTRLTPVKEVKVTTRLPKPSQDPDSVNVIYGLQRTERRVLSEAFRPDGENSQRFDPRYANSPQDTNGAASNGATPAPAASDLPGVVSDANLYGAN